LFPNIIFCSPVSLQDSPDKFECVVGDSVTLPCLYENKQSNVFWRHNVRRNVLNIINGQPSLQKQDPIFQNRAESFPSEYVNGNYSITLKNLELIHAGNYTCFIQESNEEKKLQLYVKGTWNHCLGNYSFLNVHFISIQHLLNLQNCFSPHYFVFLTEKPEEPAQRQRNSSMETQSRKIMTFLTALLGFTLHFI